MENQTDSLSNGNRISGRGDEVPQALNDALDTGDMTRIMTVLGDTARARGIARVAHETGLGRESLYKSMRPTSRPSLATVLKVIWSLGLGIQVFPRSWEPADVKGHERKNSD